MAQIVTITVQKEQAMGEKIQMEVKVLASDLEASLRPILQALDRRQFEWNARILGMNEKMGQLTLGEREKFQRILAAFNSIVFEDPDPVPADAPADVAHG